jgi:MoaA/NifB/PqqE/SkfB family radical SAM enzyme
MRNDDGSKLDVNDPNTSITDIWNNHEYAKLRKQFLNNEKPDGCRKCWNQEQQGIPSRRQHELAIHKLHLHKMETLDAPNPILLDIKLGNLCNLKCRICNSEYSHMWGKDELELFKQPISKNFGKDWTADDANWNAIKSIVDNLEVLYLSGGEPFLIQKHNELFDYMIKKDIAKNVSLKFHTNGTVRLSDYILDTLKQFKNVTMMYSIDDIGRRFEYQRPPANWDKIESNFNHALEQEFLDLRITYTISVLNALSGKEMEQWCHSIGFPLDKVFLNFLRAPIYYDLSMLSAEQKNYLYNLLGNNYIDVQVAKYLKTQHHDSVADTAWGVKDNKDLDNLRRYVIMNLDKKSKYKLEEVTPEIARLVYEEHLGNI